MSSPFRYDQRHPHNVQDKRELLNYHTPVPGDSQPLRRCLESPELTSAISKVGNPTAIVLWFKILWLEYKELIPEIREQFEATATEGAQGYRRKEIDLYLPVMDSEVAKTEGALTQHDAWSTDPTAVTLRTRVGNLRRAKTALPKPGLNVSVTVLSRLFPPYVHVCPRHFVSTDQSWPSHICLYLLLVFFFFTWVFPFYRPSFGIYPSPRLSGVTLIIHSPRRVYAPAVAHWRELSITLISVHRVLQALLQIPA